MPRTSQLVTLLVTTWWYAHTVQFSLVTNMIHSVGWKTSQNQVSSADLSNVSPKAVFTVAAVSRPHDMTKKSIYHPHVHNPPLPWQLFDSLKHLICHFLLTFANIDVYMVPGFAFLILSLIIDQCFEISAKLPAEGKLRTKHNIPVLKSGSTKQNTKVV